MNLTSADLLKQLQGLTERQLAQNITVFTHEEEFYPVQKTEFASDRQDVLDPDHLVLILSGFRTAPEI